MRRLLPRSPGARLVAGLLAFFVAVNVIALLVSTVRPQPRGEDSSAYATQPRGVAGYAELLRRTGHPVRYLREPLDEARLDPATTVVVLDAPRLGEDARSALRRFLQAGGRLVAGGEDAGRGIVPNPPEWTSDGQPLVGPTAAVPETRGLRLVSSAGGGGFGSTGGAVGALGERPVLLAVARSGRGRALLLADSSPLQNRLLASTDNAALGLALAGPPRRSVVFAESVHGFGRATGLAALPGRWRLALVIAALAALLWLASRARRLGPPEEPAGETAPARREHVEALALALGRVRDQEAAIAPVRAAARAQVVRRAALAPDAPDDALCEAALRLGYEEDEAAALAGGHGAQEPLAVGRALARGRR